LVTLQAEAIAQRSRDTFGAAGNIRGVNQSDT
jgi:hypothetical protein